MTILNERVLFTFQQGEQVLCVWVENTPALAWFGKFPFELVNLRIEKQHEHES
jgi:ribosomal protein S18 acetylase RimI-like enzyme